MLQEPAKKGRTASSTALFQLHWKRIVLDEGHIITAEIPNLREVLAAPLSVPVNICTCCLTWPFCGCDFRPSVGAYAYTEQVGGFLRFDKVRALTWRWCTCVVHCLTGLHRFLRLSPFDDITAWKKMIGSKGTPTLGHLVCITSLKTHPQTDIAIKVWRDWRQW